MLNIKEMCDYARYSDNLEKVINDLNGKEILRLDYESCYQGYVDIDVLLKDGRVFSYVYYYGSCPGCDDWEDRELTDEEIEKEMLEEGTIFKDIDSYQEWRNKVDKQR